ncbi:MAG: glycoside hydrolase family 1 protein [Candidatus Omnitrophica bacterium]|nr:glycoside hydrolase family 1 protein [Candidatus Omnitrophota bacterium]
MIKFPQGFLWGAAASAYQVEGGNSNSDWWEWEKKTGRQNSGQACRHYELYEQDFDLAKNLNQNAHRLSVEWSRIEPQEGKFPESELKHYLDVILALRRRNIEPVVTLHHFTNPAWFGNAGGWTNRRAVRDFLRYCDLVVRCLAKYVRYWITINEPNVYLTHSYIMGVWPPQARSYLKAKIVEDNFAGAHIKAYRLIRKIYKELNLPRPYVSIAQNMQAFVPCAPSLKNRFAAYIRDKWYNFGFLDAIMRHKAMDFIGVNYYSRQLVEPRNWGFASLAMDVCSQDHHPVKKNSLGWDIYPEGLYELLLKLKKYGLPIIITENGICTRDDNLRWEYIYAHLKNIHLAMGKGAKVEGYLYWSLMDNFEWDKGFNPRFGLIDVDYNTYKRTVRESAVRFAQVSKTGVLE